MLKYNNTSEIEPLKKTLGQQRAVEAMEIGLSIDNPAYNIYVAGDAGTGKGTYVLETLGKNAKNKNTHKDWCYVYNFVDQREPIIIGLKRGLGREFKNDIEKLIENLLDEIKDAFESEDFELAKNQLIEDYEIEKEELLKRIKKYGEEKGFKLKSSKVGIVFVPMDEEQEESEPSEIEFYKSKRELESMAIQLIYKIKDLEEAAKKEVIRLEDEIAKLVLEPHIEILAEKYKDYPKVIEYLKKIEIDILEYIYLFYMEEDELKEKYDKEHFIRYRVNLFVDNGAEEYKDKAPVVVETNPTPSNLFGKAEYDYYNGSIKTDFTKIMPGSVHKANGGYLVIYMDQILRYATSWDMLKRVIKSKKISVETQTCIKPEHMAVDFKVVLIGSNYIYNLLYKYDNEFAKYFKIFVDFDNIMDKTEENEYGVAQFVSYQCDKNNLKHFTYDAVQEIVKYSTRLAGDKYKLSTEFNKIMEILIEADAYSKLRDNKYVDREDVKKAISQRRKRLSKIEDKMEESIKKGFTLIETEGSKVGVINGLSVLNVGEYSFGKPSRITVTTSHGNKGIVNIEREVDMSGSIHSKGVMILGGYLAENFAQKFPLSLNAYICFEQNYGGIDGDSASGAELYALISSLSEVPLKQNIAVTGSINQKGDIQVVGGINEKVEGFYSLCNKRGLENDYGVIIPKNNKRNLVLNDEVNEAIEAGKFKIYEIERVEEAIEILTDKPFDEVKKLAECKLFSFSEIQNTKNK